MKKMIILLALMAVFSQANCLFSEDKVKGGFKQCSVYEYRFKYGEVDLNSKRILYEYYYNNKGNLKKEIYFINGNQIKDDTIATNIKIYEYDNTDNMIKLIENYWTGDKDKYTYQYDNKRNKTEEMHYTTSGCITKETYKYDTDGNEIQNISYNCDGIVESKGISIYDNNGRIIKMEVIYPDSNVNYKRDYQYDDKGKLKSMSTKDEITTIKYDDKGNKTDKISIDYEGSTNSIERFDANGNLIEIIQYFKEDPGYSDKVTYKEINKYDNYNRLIENSHETNGLFDRKDIIQYDEFGNIKSSVRYGKLNEPEFKREYVYTK